MKARLGMVGTSVLVLLGSLALPLTGASQDPPQGAQRPGALARHAMEVVASIDDCVPAAETVKCSAEFDGPVMIALNFVPLTDIYTFTFEDETPIFSGIAGFVKIDAYGSASDVRSVGVRDVRRPACGLALVEQLVEQLLARGEVLAAPLVLVVLAALEEVVTGAAEALPDGLDFTSFGRSFELRRVQIPDRFPRFLIDFP